MISTLQILSSLEVILNNPDSAKAVLEAKTFLAATSTHFQKKVDVCEYGMYRGKSFTRIVDFDRQWLERFVRDRRLHPDVRRHIIQLLEKPIG
jgi:hypothetical protein